MAGGASDEDEGLIAGINVTPLVDITLVLLIIFMVTARIIVSQGMPMDLPKSASGEALQTVFAHLDRLQPVRLRPVAAHPVDTCFLPAVIGLGLLGVFGICSFPIPTTVRGTSSTSGNP